jgi:iron complex outermembrane recepter protein
VLRKVLLGIAASAVAMAIATSYAAEPRDFNIPPGELAPALESLAKETGLELIFQPEALKGIRTRGVTGNLSPQEAVARLIDGTRLIIRTNAAGAMLIVAPESSSETSPNPVSPSSAEDLNSSLGLSLEEIVVTATKRAESIRDVPAAVSAISSEDILARGLTQYADYLNSVPGVSFQDAGPGQSLIRIRGVVGKEGGGSTSTVATYFGETITSVLTISGAKPNLRLVDIDRVEVLRGPQGTLFGANSLAGVVRIVPAAPNLNEFEADVGTRGFVTAHSDDASYHVEGVLNVPLVQDRLGLRLVAYKDEIAGYIDNVTPARPDLDWTEQGERVLEALAGLPPGVVQFPDGSLVIPGNSAFTRKDISSEDTWGMRAALAWQVNDRLRLDMTQVVQDVTLNSQPHVDPTAGPYAQDRPMDLVSQGMNTERLNISSLVATYDWDAFSLVSASSYSQLKTAYRDDSSLFLQGIFGVPVPWEDQAQSEGKVLTQEVRLQSTGEGPFQWLAGLFYLDQQADIHQIAFDRSCPSCFPTLDFGNDIAFETVGDPRFLNQEQRSVFGEVSYDFSPRWTLGLGGRYLEEDIERLNGPQEGWLVGGFVPAEDPRRGSSYEVNPSAYLRFRATEDMTFYLQSARGFRSPQTNIAQSYTGICAPEAQAVGLGPLTDPDTLWNYEIGMKSRFAERRIGLNTAVYKFEWEGVQLPIQFDCGFGGVVNGGDVGGKGAELELNARLSGAWQLNLAANYSHNEFDSVKAGTGLEVGDRPPGAAETNGSAGLQYGFAVNADWVGFARADYVYVGSTRYLFGQIDPRVVTLDSYDTTNVRLGLQRENLTVELFGRNITDERAVVNTVDPSQGNREFLARPREIGIEIRYSFARGN